MFLILCFLDVDNVLQRMTIIGVILSFRSLCQDALNDVLQERIPFLLSSIVDFKHHVPNGEAMVSQDFFAQWFTVHYFLFLALKSETAMKHQVAYFLYFSANLLILCDNFRLLMKWLRQLVWRARLTLLWFQLWERKKAVSCCYFKK